MVLSFSFRLISLSMVISRSIHIAANGIISFLLWPSNNQLYYIYIYKNMHHIFIHSSTDGHLGCFHVFAIINNDAVNIGCRYLFKLQFIQI